ncbi:MAG: hypothetical protein ABIH70_07170 [Chloroflexota bacterium]
MKNLTGKQTKQQKWLKSLNDANLMSPDNPAPEPVLLTPNIISEWLAAHHAEHKNPDDAVDACVKAFRLQRRQRKTIAEIYAETQFADAHSC